VATIGIFDGVHRAHQVIIEKLNATAAAFSGESVIVTLWPHPRIVLQKEEQSLFLLNTMEEKIEQLDKAGVDNLVIIPFDEAFAGIGFLDFVRKILVDKLHIAHLVVGYNHHFGKNREGNFEKLKSGSEQFGFRLSQQGPVIIKGEKVSSSVIRHLLIGGDIVKANDLLGYYYTLSGKVVEGHRKGREIGFPTANIDVSYSLKLIPADGVYAVLIHLNKQKYKGMMNIGCRPTLNTNCYDRSLEVHIFGFNGDLYQQELRIEFIARIRNERKFDTLAALKEQLTLDQKKIELLLNGD
jgi:riboflavin kinase/FMN adenylyltransferase